MWILQILLDFLESLLAFLIPHPKMFLSKEFKDWLISCCHLRYKLSNVIQTTQVTYFFVLDADIAWIAFTLLGSTSIPWLLTQILVAFWILPQMNILWGSALTDTFSIFQTTILDFENGLFPIWILQSCRPLTL
jgi:hypothetical protein